MDCMTRSLDGNKLNPLPERDLWKSTIKKKAQIMSKCGALPTLKNGKFDARRLPDEGI